MSAPGAQCFSAGKVMVLCGVVWSGGTGTAAIRRSSRGNGVMGTERDSAGTVIRSHSLCTQTGNATCAQISV